MHSCLVWGSGLIFHKNIPLLKYFEQSGKIIVSGITSKDSLFETIAGYKYIPKLELCENNRLSQYDKIIVMADGNAYKEICSEIIDLGFPDKNIVPYKVMGLVGFDFEKYEKLRENTPTIIAPNCWGGITYNTLGLSFKSSIINMFIEPDDYMKMIGNLEYYMDQELEYVRSQYNSDIDITYPVLRCGDILLHFNHYNSVEEAIAKWEQRKKRINWNNLFIMFFDEFGKKVEDFSRINNKKKIYFYKELSPEDKSDWMLKLPCPLNDNAFYNIVNRCGKGEIVYYDVFELLLNGKIVLHSTI